MTDPISPDGSRAVPRHLAIIMDGNGRWAEARGLNRVRGHQQGAVAARRIIEHAALRGVKILTLFAFSSENWRRPAYEVQSLMTLFAQALKKESGALRDNGIALRVVGDISRFAPPLRRAILECEELTAPGGRMRLNLAANYGGRWDIVQAARQCADSVKNGAISSADISEDRFQRLLAVPEDVDLLVRTGGEHRVSNFLMWQCSYSEIYVSQTLWPDFSAGDLDAAFDFFRQRERRFGMTSAQLKQGE